MKSPLHKKLRYENNVIAFYWEDNYANSKCNNRPLRMTTLSMSEASLNHLGSSLNITFDLQSNEDF